MKDVINQIIEIDKLAVQNNKKNGEILVNSKKDYMDKLEAYKNSKIAIAKKNADLINQSIQENLSKQENINNNKIKNLTVEMEAKYLQVEKDVMNKIFNKLFVLEG